MVNAVNSTIKTIMSKNKDSRIGVVGFSDDASTIIDLGNYSTTGNYLTLTDGRNGKKITPNVAGSSRNVTGGTNTQSGIKAGAKMLMDVTDTKYTVTINGKEESITRTPLLIIVTDGEPTYYYSNESATGDRHGSGSSSNENYYYWTIRTAQYYKQQITNKYYPKADNTAKVFTIGIGISGDKAITMLNPNKTNVDLCDTNGYDDYGWFGKERN